jgi:hypothetical protein
LGRPWEIAESEATHRGLGLKWGGCRGFWEAQVVYISRSPWGIISSILCLPTHQMAEYDHAGWEAKSNALEAAHDRSSKATRRNTRTATEYSINHMIGYIALWLSTWMGGSKEMSGVDLRLTEDLGARLPTLLPCRLVRSTGIALASRSDDPVFRLDVPSRHVAMKKHPQGERYQLEISRYRRGNAETDFRFPTDKVM